MPRPRKSIPSYLPHKQSGRARAVWTDSTGARQFRTLPGLFESAESRAAFARLVAELAASPATSGGRADPTGITVNEVLLAYLHYAARHSSSPDGRPTDEARHIKTACR